MAKRIHVRILWIITATAFATVVLAGALIAYFVVYAPNVDLGQDDTRHVYVPRGSNYHDVLAILDGEEVIRHPGTFHWVAQRKNYPARILPGRYLVRHGMSNNALVNLLRSGEQDPVRLTFTNIHTREQLAAAIAGRLALDAVDIIELLEDNERMERFGMDAATAKLLFIPNTYQVYWTVSAEQLFERMYREYNAFWNGHRRERADATGLTPIEVGILASIVQSETSKQDELARIAGVYINRLERGIPLQADPTVIYAIGDFSIRRVLNHHLTVDSPYNTYMYAGLPPGPINLPEPLAMDAVLHHEQHDYLYFSARADFSGYHEFATTYREHLRNARRYRQALDKMNVFR